jgi:hypothetical protein
MSHSAQQRDVLQEQGKAGPSLTLYDEFRITTPNILKTAEGEEVRVISEGNAPVPASTIKLITIINYLVIRS